MLTITSVTFDLINMALFDSLTPPGLESPICLTLRSNDGEGCTKYGSYHGQSGIDRSIMDLRDLYSRGEKELTEWLRNEEFY